MKTVHGGANHYKYIGTKSDKFVTGQKYTYDDMAELTGINISTLRSRMGRIRGNVITDDVLLPKRKAFTNACLLYTSPSPRDVEESRMPSSA